MTVRDFAYRLNDEGLWAYGEERSDPFNALGHHPREGYPHPFTREAPDATHAYLKVSVDYDEGELARPHLVVGVSPPEHPGKCIQLPLEGRDTFWKVVIEAMEATPLHTLRREGEALDGPVKPLPSV